MRQELYLLILRWNLCISERIGWKYFWMLSWGLRYRDTSPPRSRTSTIPQCYNYIPIYKYIILVYICMFTLFFQARGFLFSTNRFSWAGQRAKHPCKLYKIQNTITLFRFETLMAEPLDAKSRRLRRSDRRKNSFRLHFARSVGVSSYGHFLDRKILIWGKK